MEKFHVDWLLGELEVLVEKGVVTGEVSKKISDYYKNAKASAATPAEATPVAEKTDAGESSCAIVKEKSKKQEAKIPAITAEHIPLILTGIACVLIVAGLISLIAYNWNAIPRFAKAIASFVLLLAVQTGGAFAMFGKKAESKAHLREGAALIWSLLFGGVLAFISQICRLPGDTSSFFLLWALSSILIMYALNARIVFFFALAETAAYGFTYDRAGGGVFVFFLLFAALFFFARKKRFEVRLMLCTAALMLGFVLEKSIPGLWIVCSVSFAVLSLEYAENSGDRLMKNLSFAGLCILLLLLTENSFWTGIGFNFLRQGPNPLGCAMDLFLAFSLTAAAIGIPLRLFFKKVFFQKREMLFLQLARSLCPLLVAVLYVTYSFTGKSFQEGSFLAPTAIAYLFAFLFFVHALYAGLFFSAALFFSTAFAIYLADFSAPALAASALLLWLDFLLHSRIQRLSLQTASTKASRLEKKYFLCCILLRASFFVLLIGLSLNTSWLCFWKRGDSAPALFHFILYALLFSSGLYLSVRGALLKRSADLLLVALSVTVIFALNSFSKNALYLQNPEAVCFVLLFAHFAATSFDFLLFRKEGHLKSACFYFPFICVFVFYLFSSLHFNYPLLAGFSFLLLLEGLESFRLEKNESQEGGIHLAVRLFQAILFSLPLFLKETDIVHFVAHGKSLPFQLASYSVYALAGLLLLIMSGKWKDSLDTLIFSFCMVLLTFVDGKGLAFTFLYESISLCACLCGFFRLKKAKAYLLILLANQYLLLSGLFSSGMLLLALVLLSALSYYRAEEKFHALEKPSQIVFALSLFLASFIEIGFLEDPYGKSLSGRDYLHIVFCMLHTLLLALMVFLPSVKKLIKKEACNYIIALYSLSVFVLVFMCQAVSLSGYTLITEAVGKIFLALSFVFLCLNAGFYIAKAYRTENIALANTAGLTASLSVIIKFFSNDYGFVAKGVIFILLGIAMLILNIFLLNMNRKNSGKKEEQK